MDEGSSTSTENSSFDNGSPVGSAVSTPTTPQRLPVLSAAAALQTPASSPFSSTYSISSVGTPASCSSLLVPLSEAISENRLQAEPIYEAKSDVPYDAKAINTILPASLTRYNLKRINGNKFLLVQKNTDTNTYIAITPPIEIGKQFNCIADYFKGENSKNTGNSRTGSPMSPGSSILRPNELWQELNPFLSQKELVIKILYPYTTSNSSWVIGEIVISKNTNKYEVTFSVYDPLGNARLEPLDHQGIKDHVTKEIHKIDNLAFVTSSAREKRITMLAPDDIVSSGIMSIEILLCLAENIEPQQLTKNPPLHFRNLHLQAVMAYYDIEHSTNRKRFISTYARIAAQSERSLINHSAETRVIRYGAGNDKYLPLFTEAQEQYLLQHGNSVEVRNINCRAAFQAARTGNKMLMEALLGPEVDEEAINERLEDLAKEAYALSQDRSVIHFTIVVLEMQIKKLQIYSDTPELDRNAAKLKHEIEEEINHIAAEFADAYINDHLGAREDEKVMFNMRLIKMRDLDAAARDVLKNSFRDRLLTYKAKFYSEFNLAELSTLHTNLSQNHTAHLKSYEEMHTTISQRNMESQILDGKLKQALDKHRRNVGTLWKLRRATLPDFFPKDEFSFWLHMLSARVPVELRESHNDCNTLLHIAWLYGHSNVASLLLARGANPKSENNQRKTPYQLLNEPEQRLIALSQNAPLLMNKESEFVRLIQGFCATFLLEVGQQEEICRGNHGIYGLFARRFIDPELITSRKAILLKLVTLIEDANAECNDAVLYESIRRLLTSHYKKSLVHIKDSLPFNGTDFYNKLTAIFNTVATNKSKYYDFRTIRLPGNLDKYLLESCAYTAEGKLKEAQAQIEIKEAENQRLKSERDEVIQKLEQETKLRIDLQQQLEEERRKTAEDISIIEQRLRENEQLRRIAATSSEAAVTSPRQRSESTPAAVAAGSPKASPLGQNRNILLNGLSAPAVSLLPPSGAQNAIEMQQFSTGASSESSPKLSK